ncbi:MAG: low temperature requirement protein A [Parasporobacterium sp.]|nr:low temperature requirement protein A [Parasporobacterium sp.]
MELGEKKVEYIELIYDLIFVYFIGRSNSILHETERGFFSFDTYIAYVLSLLVILHVWYLSTMFINRYGDNSIRNFIGLFINMYLIYYMANATRADWEGYYLRYVIAWALILLNLAVQYFIVLQKNKKDCPWEIPNIRRHILFLVIQAAIIFATLPLYRIWNIPWIWVPLLAGFIFIIPTQRSDSLFPVNFEHLTERVMLFVVFTFGEMIISVAAYFETSFSLSMVYFSLMTFLIAAGLFLSYGYVYNHIIDRKMNTTGTAYMFLHVFLLVALCNITAALGYMRDPSIETIPKNILIVVSFLVYFCFLLLIGIFSKETERLQKRTLIFLVLTVVAYLIIMWLFYGNSYISVAASALFVLTIHLCLVLNHRSIHRTSLSRDT